MTLDLKQILAEATKDFTTQKIGILRHGQSGGSIFSLNIVSVMLNISHPFIMFHIAEVSGDGGDDDGDGGGPADEPFDLTEDGHAILPDIGSLTLEERKKTVRQFVAFEYRQYLC